ncbi:MAG: hypothetical protein LBG06_04665 [Deltaproteobacteria bacterium]|nr:hypothetical protein [Deltaproteobacteria bacterium]
MSKVDFYEMIDKVSRKILLSVEEIDSELASMVELEAEKIREIVPTVMLSIAVMRLCQNNPPDEVLRIIKILAEKVEIGDFHPGGVASRDTPPLILDDDVDDNEEADDDAPSSDLRTKKGPTLN